MLYDYDTSKHLNVTTGSLDSPALFTPGVQFGKEARMPWFKDICRLADEGTTEGTMADWVCVIKASNHQHPDHDTGRWPL